MKASSAIITSFATMLYMSSPALAGNCEGTFHASTELSHVT